MALLIGFCDSRFRINHRQARSYVQARGGSCLLVPRRLNVLETQINVMRNCVKRKKYDRKGRFSGKSSQLLPKLSLGELTALPRPLAGFKGAYFSANLFTVDSRRVVPAR